MIVVGLVALAFVGVLAIAQWNAHGVGIRVLNVLVLVDVLVLLAAVFASFATDDVVVVGLAYAGLVVGVVVQQVALTTSSYIRHMRDHLRDLRQSPIPAPTPPELSTRIAEAEASGFVVVPEGTLVADGGHGVRANLVDQHGRVAEITAGPLEADGLSTLIVSLGTDGAYLATSDSPATLSGDLPWIDLAASPGADIVQLLDVHRAREDEARAKGVTFRGVRADECVSVSRAEDERAWVQRLERPWRSAYRSLRAAGWRALLGVRRRRA